MTEKIHVPPVLVIACDGGGMRGVISAELLKRMNGIHRNAYMFAGTSTGAILAASLANGIGPTGVVTRYMESGPDIFKHRDRRDSWSRLDELGRANYDHKGLSDAMARDIGSVDFGDHGQGERPHLMVTSFDLDRNRPKVWCSMKSDQHGDSVVNSVLCSCSAPTYFPSYPDDKTSNRHIDGGVVANSPGMCAVAELLRTGVPLDKIWLLALGTGIGGSPVDLDPHPETHDAGLLKWAPDIVDLVMGGSEKLVDYQLQQILGSRYFRADVPMSKRVKIDDTRPASIKSMQADVGRWFGEKSTRRAKFNTWNGAFNSARIGLTPRTTPRF